MTKYPPADVAELSDADLEHAAGGMRWYPDDKETENFEDLRGQGKSKKAPPPKKEIPDSMVWTGFGSITA